MAKGRVAAARSPYQAVIFDFFGTLVDSFSVSAHEGTLRQMAGVLGCPPGDFIRWWTQETLPARLRGEYDTLEANISLICRALGVEPAPERVPEAAAMRLGFTRQGLAPRADAVSTLTEVKRRGLKTGLISDCSMELPLLWAETAFADLIDAPVFSASAGLTKPDPRIYRLACEGLGVPPSECLYVGDGGSGELSGAAGVGMTAVLIQVPYENADDTYRFGVERWDGPMIAALGELPGLLDALSATA